MNLYYVANARLPTDKAHGLQIVENCEALAAEGARVSLIAPRRRHGPEGRADADPYAHYGVERTFQLDRVWCLDLFPLGRWLEWLAYPVLTLTFAAAAAARLRRRPAGIIYTRHLRVLAVLLVLRPADAYVYEAHQSPRSSLGRALERVCLRRARAVFAVTDRLADACRRQGARSAMVARDGFRASRFLAVPDRLEARRRLGLPADAFIVGYVGRLRTLGMTKGLGSVVDAIAALGDPRMMLCVVGGPAGDVAALRGRWRSAGLDDAACRTPGQVPPRDVPAYLAALDVCVLPFPMTPHFAGSASPLKLFEYMAAGRPIVASSLEAIAEVVEDGRTALLVPPSDAAALAAALARLRDEPALGARLGAAAREASRAYDWRVRARRILAALEQTGGTAAGGGAD